MAAVSERKDHAAKEPLLHKAPATLPATLTCTASGSSCTPRGIHCRTDQSLYRPCWFLAAQTLLWASPGPAVDELLQGGPSRGERGGRQLTQPPTVRAPGKHSSKQIILRGPCLSPRPYPNTTSLYLWHTLNQATDRCVHLEQPRHTGW